MESLISYCQGNATQIFFGIIKVFIISVVLLICFFIFKMFTLFLPSLLSLIVLIFLLYKFIIFVCRLFTFPGSAWFWKRNNENHFRKAFVFKIKRRISALRSLVEYLLEARLWHNFLTELELLQIKRVITSILNLFTKQAAIGSLSTKQKEMMDCFVEIENVLNGTNLVNKANQKQFSVWGLLQAERHIIEDLEKPNSALYFEDKSQGALLLEKCKDLERRLNDIIRDKSTFQKVKRWLYDDSFGSLDQLRIEIDNKYNTHRILLEVEKKVTLDCMLLSAKTPEDPAQTENNIELRDKIPVQNTNRQEHSHDVLQSTSMRMKGMNPVIIICCPNAGYYECMHYENDWIDFYVKNGLSVFLWNYRGYGRSTGKPSPNVLRRDGETIVDYLRDKFGVTKIGIHGESIGGLVAIHVARKKNVDFLCADRTFMNLSNVGSFSFGSLTSKLYQLVTLWDDNIPSDYINSTCYKVITFDPKDEVIHSLSSLKYGVTRKVIEGRLGISGEPVKPSLAKNSFLFELLLRPFLQFIFSAKFCLYERRVNSQIKEYYNLLDKEQMLALYKALHRIAELFGELSSSHGFSALKQQNARVFKPMNPRTHSNSLKPVQVGSSEVESPHARSESQDIPDEEGTVQIAMPQAAKRDITEEKIYLNNHDKTIHQTIDIKGFDYQDQSILTKSTNKKCYVDRFNEESRASDHTITLLLRLFPIFEDLEASGIQISDVNAIKSEHQFEFFKFYIQCFDVWGSYLPLFKTIQEEGKELVYHQNLAINKIQKFITKLDHVIKTHDRNESNNTSSKNLISDIMEDLELTRSLFTVIYNRLTEKMNKGISTLNSKVLSDLEIGADELTVNNATMNDRRTRGGKLIQDKDKRKDTLDDQVDIATSSSLGHLIPLSCGHNGSFKQHELEFYEYHLKNSKLLDR